MRRPIVTRYEPDPALSWPRQTALLDAFSAFKTDALIHRDAREHYTARMRAKDCRKLLAAFGVRLTQRREISVARQGQIMAEWLARDAANAP